MPIRLYVCMYVCLYVCLSVKFKGNVIFSAPNWDIAPFFLVQIPLINEHLFCKYFVRLSVGKATKALLLIDVFILVCSLNPFFCLYSPDKLIISEIFNIWYKNYCLCSRMRRKKIVLVSYFALKIVIDMFF